MFGLGAPELLVVMVLALLVFGPSKLPEMMASVGQAIREFQRASRELTEVFQETQQEFQSALDLDEQHQAAQATAGYEAPAEEGTIAAEPPPVTAQPEEFETAAAMVDPVEPFQVPAEPEPEPIAAVAEPPKPKRSRRKKSDAAVAETGAADEAAAVEDAVAVADPPAVEPPVAAEPPAAEPPAAEAPATEPPSAAEVTTTVTPGISASTPIEEPAPNGTAPHVNGTAPKPRRRRATVAASAEDA